MWGKTCRIETVEGLGGVDRILSGRRTEGDETPRVPSSTVPVDVGVVDPDPAPPPPAPLTPTPLRDVGVSAGVGVRRQRTTSLPPPNSEPGPQGPVDRLGGGRKWGCVGGERTCLRAHVYLQQRGSTGGPSDGRTLTDRVSVVTRDTHPRPPSPLNRRGRRRHKWYLQRW